MASKFVDNGPPPTSRADFDSQFYERQVPPSGPFFDNSFALATARAKDQARENLIDAMLKADSDARSASFTGFGDDSLSSQLTISRSIDGNDQAPLDDVKL